VARSTTGSDRDDTMAVSGSLGFILGSEFRPIYRWADGAIEQLIEIKPG
jgi:hypothetical protein